MANSNLTSGQVLPGFWAFVDFNASGAGQEPARRALLWGFIKSTGQYTPNVPRLPADQNDANDGCGRGSDLARAYAAAVSQPESQGCEVWVMPITAPSGGVASIHTMKVLVANTNPAKAGTIQIWCCSRQLPAVGFSTTDTATTIADAITAAFNTMLDLPLGTVSNVAGLVSIPYAHKGAMPGEDLPIRMNISPGGTGVTVAAASLDFASSATGAGSVKVEFGALSVSTALSGGEAAAAVASAVVASFNADTYPLYAAVDAGDTTIANLLYANDKDVRRVRASIITSTGLTVNLGSGATDGTGSASSFSYNGTLGTGAPSVSAALTNLAALDMFRSWAEPWLDTTTLGSLATNIENNSDGSINGQKQQTLTFCDFRPSSVAGAIPPAVSPNLTSTAPHYALLWSPDCAVQGIELAARIAAARAALWLDTPQKNWNGFQAKGSESAPLLLSASKPSRDAQNTALRTYALAPLIPGPSGNMEVVKGRTTSLAADKRLWAWSSEAQAAYHAIDLTLFLKSLFEGGSIVRYSDPKAPGIFDDNSIKSAMQRRMRDWESQGNYDGADALADAVKVTVNQSNPFRFDLQYPDSPVLDLDQIVFVGHFTSPSV